MGLKLAGLIDFAQGRLQNPFHVVPQNLGFGGPGFWCSVNSPGKIQICPPFVDYIVRGFSLFLSFGVILQYFSRNRT